MTSLDPRIVVEVDLPYCGNTYGVSPCTATLGVTGADRCYNCIRTCQDRANFTETTRVLRLSDSAPDPYFTLDGVPVSTIPSITSVSITPAVVKPGVDAGERESVSVVCREHPDSDTLLDKYYALRDYDPMTRGTFWSKLRARWVDLEGAVVRIKRGYAGQDLNTYNTRYYIVAGISGGGLKSVTLKAKDPFVLTDSKKSRAPVASNGALSAAISAAATSLTLTPTGVGNEEYPSSGEVCLGSKEVCAFTRSGDVLTLTRGIANTEAQEHDEDTSVQLVLKYTAVNGGAIIADLLTNYTEGIEAAWVDSAAFESEISAYYGTLFTARITTPTAVQTLINELIAQLPAVFYWDSTAQAFRLYALRPATPDANVFEHLIEGSFSVTEQPSKRCSDVLTYYGQRDPTQKVDETSNYACGLLLVDDEASADYATPSTKQVTSRWIPSTARSTAQVLNATLLERYRDPPRAFNFSVWRNHVPVPELGQNFRITHSALQDESGAQIILPAQITSIEVTEGSYQCTAEEIIFASQDGSGSSGIRFIYLDADEVNLNLRQRYNELYTSLDGITELRVVMGAGIYLGAAKTTGLPGAGTTVVDYALKVLAEDWADAPGLTIILEMTNSYVIGAGGYASYSNYSPGYLVGYAPTGLHSGNGGPAIHATRPVTIRGTGTIGGGGGGGAPWTLIRDGSHGSHSYIPLWQMAGQGGAGYEPGELLTTFYGDPYTVATRLTPVVQDLSTSDYGQPHIYCRGGFLGENGTQPQLLSGTLTGLIMRQGVAGIAGHAIDGIANITIEPGSSITILGPTT